MDNAMAIEPSGYGIVAGIVGLSMILAKILEVAVGALAKKMTTGNPSEEIKMYILKEIKERQEKLDEKIDVLMKKVQRLEDRKDAN